MMGRAMGGMVGGLLLAAGLLAGCAPRDGARAFQLPFLPQYRAAQDGTPVLLGNARWWRPFADPTLDRLIDRALTGNLSLEAARERVVESRATLEAVPGAAALDASVGGRVEGAGAGSSRLSSTAQLGLSWMLDPYGSRRARLDAAQSGIRVAEAELDAARLLMIFNMANAYVELRYAQYDLTLRERDLSRQGRTLSVVRELAASGEATELDVTRTRARLAGVEAEIPAVRARITGLASRIAVLAGAVPGTLPPDLAAALDAPGSGRPHPTLSPDVGIPADLLRNRPDLRVAEARYYQSVANIRQARADLYPRLSLVGLISLDLLRSGDTASFYLGPTVTFPQAPLNGGRVAATQSRARQAYTDWRATALDAILEVETALLDYRAATQAAGSARTSQTLYLRTLELTRQVFGQGGATLNDLLDVERELAAAERTLAATLQRQALSYVALNVRLGAGHAAGSGDAAR